MKKYFIASVVALAVILGSAASANAAFTSYLTVGSTGADVVNLQTWLISNGYDIAAISSGAATKGYFGQQTKAAVVKYQAAIGLPSTGFVGPLTIAKLNGTGGVLPTAPGCNPVYYNCTPVTGTPVVTTPGAPLVMDGTDGSVTVSLSSYAGNNTIKKGETKDLIAVKLQATAGAVGVSRFDVRLDKRPWLYFSTITLKDSNGVVIATKNLSSAADATELTVGTDYLVRFDGINAVVTPGTDRTLVVSGTVLSVTDKIVSGTDVTVNASIPSASIRTINGKGYTDSIGLSGTVFTAGTNSRVMTLSASGSIANVLVKLDSVSPDTRIVTTSTSGETNGVVLGKFSFKSENRASTLNTLKFTIAGIGADAADAIKRLYVSNGTQTVQVDTVGTTSTFSNLTFNLPQDVWTTVTVTADLADQDEFPAGAVFTASTTVNTTNIVGVDSNFTTVTASGANIVNANSMTFLPVGVSVTVGSSPVTLVQVDNGSSAVTKKDITFKFTVNNTGSNDIYISRDPHKAVATSTTFAATTTSLESIAVGSSMNNDTSTVYIVPAGASRQFTLSGQIDNTRNASDKVGEVKITAVYFGDDTTNIQESNVSSGLDALTTGVNSFQ